MVLFGLLLTLGVITSSNAWARPCCEMCDEFYYSCVDKCTTGGGDPAACNEHCLASIRWCTNICVYCEGGENGPLSGREDETLGLSYVAAL
jgi:hypothetical protein